MNKLLANSINKVKQEIKNMYLSGDSVSIIARHFNVSNRDVYYHLGKLTPEDKGLHAMNLSLKQTLRKGAYGKRHKKSQGTKVESGLADFE